MKTISHPTDEHLRRFLREEDGSSLNTKIAQHLDRCGECRVRVEEILSVFEFSSEPTSRDVSSRRRAVGRSGKVGLDVNSLQEEIGPRYIVKSEIDRGGMGVVYLAYDRELHREIAIKISKSADSTTYAARFYREAKISAQLEHPSIVSVYDTGRLRDQRQYIALKLIKGETLASVIKKRDPGEQASQLFQVFNDVVNAMAYAHSRDFIHRDLKPNNVMVGMFGEVQIMDWGLARKLKKGDDVRQPNVKKLKSTADNETLGMAFAKTLHGDVIGTPAYMPPEQARGDVVDKRTDVFALGGILYQILTGKPPFDAPTASVALSKSIASDLIKAYERLDNCGADPELIKIVRRCLAANPDDRPDDAQAVNVQFSEYQSGREQKFEETRLEKARTTERLIAQQKRNRQLRWAATAILVAFAASAFAGYLYINEKTRRERDNRASVIAARSQANAAEVAEYSASMRLAWNTLQSGSVESADGMVQEWIPETPPSSLKKDRRNWEWYFLREQVDSSSRILSQSDNKAFNLDLSPDESLLATVVNKRFHTKFHGEGYVLIQEFRTGKELARLVHPGSQVSDVCFLPDGKRLVTIGVDLTDSGKSGTVALWEISSLNAPVVVRELEGKFDPGLANHSSTSALPTVTSIDDGASLLCGPTFHLLDSDHLEVQAKFDVEQGSVAAPTPDGEIAVLGAGRLHLFDLKGTLLDVTDMSATLKRKLRHPNFQFATGSFTAACPDKNELFVWWNLAKPNLFQRWTAPGLGWGRLTPSGRQRVWSTRDGVLHVSLVAKDHQQFTLFGHRNAITDGVVTRDERFLVTSSHDGTVREWDLENSTKAIQAGRSPEAIRFSQSGSELYTAGCVKDSGRENGIRVTLNPKYADDEIQLHHIACTRSVVGVKRRQDFSYHPHQPLLAAPLLSDNPETERSKEPGIGIWKLTDETPQFTFNDGFQNISATAWDPEDLTLLVVGMDDSDWKMCLVDCAQSQCVKLCEWALPKSDPSAKQSPPCALAREFAAVATNDQVLLLERRGAKADQHLEALHEYDISSAVCLSFSPDGRKLAALCDNPPQISVIDCESGDVDYTVLGPSTPTCCRFSPDGTRLAAVGSDARIFLYDVLSGSHVLELTGSGSARGTSPCNSRIAFSSDGSQIATNNFQGIIQVWSLGSSADEFCERRSVESVTDDRP